MSFLRKKKRSRRTYVLNLIPILDAIFIIIFFLLMSTHFVKFNEISSESPDIKLVDQQSQEIKTEPLNLTLEIFPDQIIIKTKVDGQIVKILPHDGQDYDFKGLLKEAIALKTSYIHENAVILKPESSVFYKEIVKVIDTLRELPLDAPTIRGRNKKGKIIATRRLFDQVIFESMPKESRGNV